MSLVLCHLHMHRDVHHTCAVSSVSAASLPCLLLVAVFLAVAHWGRAACASGQYCGEDQVPAVLLRLRSRTGVAAGVGAGVEAADSLSLSCSIHCAVDCPPNKF